MNWASLSVSLLDDGVVVANNWSLSPLLNMNKLNSLKIVWRLMETNLFLCVSFSYMTNQHLWHMHFQSKTNDTMRWLALNSHFFASSFENMIHNLGKKIYTLMYRSCWDVQLWWHVCISPLTSNTLAAFHLQNNTIMVTNKLSCCYI